VSVGPRKDWRQLTGHEIDRNGEPAEEAYGCALLLVTLVAILVLVAVAIVDATVAASP
jgi:hypothetical protein